MEGGDSSTSAPPFDSSINSNNGDVWAKLVPLDSQCSDIELTLNETLVSSKINVSSSGMSEWCKITRNMDLVSATLQNKSEDEIFVDEMVVQGGDTAVVRCGAEIILGSDSESKGLLRYRFKVMPAQESGKKQLKIFLDAEHVICCICLNVWHDVVTVAPCLHNFCNGCFSEWLRRSKERHAKVRCPQCRAVVQFVGRNHFLHSIEEDILKADDSLRRPIEEIAALDSCATIKSPLGGTSSQPQQQDEEEESSEEDIRDNEALDASFRAQLQNQLQDIQNELELGRSERDMLHRAIIDLYGKCNVDVPNYFLNTQSSNGRNDENGVESESEQDGSHGE